MHTHPENAQDPYQSRPFLKWAGGKQRLVKHIQQHLPRSGRLIEPFLGAGSVFLGTSYNEYLLGDANADLMAMWVALQNRPREFIERAELMFRPEYWSSEAYYRLRDEYNDQADRFERAVLFVYLNRFGFNGVYRVNRKGKMNTPYGKPAALPRFPWDELTQAALKLQRATLHAGGFRFALEQARQGDVVYCDPPYSDVGKDSFTAYTEGGFGVAEHEELCSLARVAAGRGATVAISNHLNDHTRALYRGWDLVELSVHRSVASDQASRGTASEVLAVLRP